MTTGNSPNVCVFTHPAGPAGQKGTTVGDYDNHMHMSKQRKEFQQEKTEVDTSKHAKLGKCAADAEDKAAQGNGGGGKDGGDAKNGKHERDAFNHGSSEGTGAGTGAGTGEGKDKGDGDEVDKNGNFENLQEDGDDRNTTDDAGDKKKKQLRDGPLAPETVKGKTYSAFKDL